MTAKTRIYLYLGSLGLFALAMLAGGFADLTRQPAVVEAMGHLGYPGYVASLLGAWKVLGVAALVAPGFPRLKEWAYAGFAFDLSGAAISHLVSGDGLGKAMVPLFLLGIGLASWALRPDTRRLVPASA